MDNVEALHQVLQQSFSPDAHIRKPAEDTIRNLKNHPGAVSLLLTVVAEKQVRFEVRQAAAIQLKNICREGWTERIRYNHNHNSSNGNSSHNEAAESLLSTIPPLLADADKDHVRNVLLLPTLLNEPEKSIRDLLAETLLVIITHDFPEKWPSLIPTLLSTIQAGIPHLHNNNNADPTISSSANTLHVHNALLALRKVCKRYEYKSREHRGPLNDIVHVAFPLLLPLGQELILISQDANNPIMNLNLDVAMMLKQILKIFWSCTQFYLPGGGSSDNDPKSTATANDNNTTTPTASSSSIGLAHPEKLQPWFDLITRALQKSLPDELQPIDLDVRTNWPWWKVKKWAVQIMSRLFSRNGIPSYADDDESKTFALYFSQGVAPQFLGPVCDTLNLRPHGRFCTDRVVHLCLTYVDLAVELSSTYRMLKPHLDFLLYKVCFPTICLHPDDIETFENDPVEFVHKQNSPLADYYDPRTSGINLMVNLVKQRGQDVTNPLLGRMTEIISRYMTSPDPQKNHIEKDGALFVFGSLAKLLMAKDKYAHEIEGLLVSSVFPDFHSSVAFLRYRACWVVQQFSGVEFTDDGSHLRNLLDMVLHRLSDPALPVQIEACKALRFLIDVDGVESTLLPILPQMLNEYFRIMNEIGNDEVVSALQALLDRFGDHIQPHASTLVSKLTDSFLQYCSAAENEDDDDASLAAEQCLECITTVLKGVCTSPELLMRLEPLLLPLVLKILGNDGDFIEYLESGLDILLFLTYFQVRISPEAWQAFPLIYIAFDQWAYDYLNLMVPCVQAFISKNPDQFLAGQATLHTGVIPYVDLVCSMVSKTLVNDRATEHECRHALSLFMCLLHHCHGRVDAYLSYINDITLGKLGQQVNAQSPLTRFSIYQVLSACLFYNAQLEVLELEKRGVTLQLLDKWLEDLQQMDRWLPQKLSVLGLASILTIPTSSLPSSVGNVLPALVHGIATVSIALKEELERDNGNYHHGVRPDNADVENASPNVDIDDENDQDDDENVDLDNGFGEDEDVKNNVDEAYRKALQGVTNWEDDMAKLFAGDCWDEDGEDVDENYVSPVEQVDEVIFVSDHLRLAFSREPTVYQALLSPDTFALCQQVFREADVRRSAAQASQQQTSLSQAYQ